VKRREYFPIIFVKKKSKNKIDFFRESESKLNVVEMHKDVLAQAITKGSR